MIGRKTKYEKTGGKDDMGIGQMPKSVKNPMGKGQGPVFKTKKGIYSKNTGKAENGVV